MKRKRSFTDEEFIEAVKSSMSIRKTLIKLGLVPSGNSYRVFHKAREKLGVSSAHFLGQGYLKGKTHNYLNKRPIQEYLKKNISCSSHHLRKRLIKEGLKENKCELCGSKPLWNDMKLVMHLDHINGDKTDNRIENLRLLCPNCHSQTSTYCGKNKGK